ncbi:hypothetical protein AB205_0084120 [Aquarana catesbeiana]|uniref:Uncharacterized protein n=1 Tax=Aquarana catesbeiana TaxID=8400 RepID=A0A2G9QH30_AQUCT|nr:hypothetical protein AB205_0084120 [Aquarana catesbeiana]
MDCIFYFFSLSAVWSWTQETVVLHRSLLQVAPG